MDKTPKVWLTKKEAGRYLSASIRSIENYINQGIIKSYRLGGKVLIEQSELNEAILNSRSGSKRKS